MIEILNIEPDNYCPRACTLLSKIGNLTELKPSRLELLDKIHPYHILITRLEYQIDEELLNRAANLKAVVTNTTGLNHIDTDAAKSNGITILSLKGETQFLESITSTAEHTWGLLLLLARRTHLAHSDVLKGNWIRNNFVGQELRGKRLGILGYGRLGKMTAKYGIAFDMDVHAYDPFEKTDGVVRSSSLRELMSTSDVVTIHVPLNTYTHGLVGPNELSLMKSSALLINTSRGEVVDETALIESLNNNCIGGAALDVLTGETAKRLGSARWPNSEPLVHYARTHNNLVLTPHIGGATADSLSATDIFLAQKVVSLFSS